MREFHTGATRDSDENKLDYEGFLSPLVLRRFAGYMHRHRIQADGELRASDNWQKGIPTSQYMKSAWRHFMDVWSYHRRPEPRTACAIIALDEAYEEALCALLFNIMGLVYNQMRGDDFEFDSLMGTRTSPECRCEPMPGDSSGCPVHGCYLHGEDRR